MINNPQGAYSQLIRLQETRTVSDHTGLNVHDSILAFRSAESSPRRNSRSSPRRNSRSSPRRNSTSSPISFSISFGIPTASSMLDTAPVEPDIPASALEKKPPKVSLRRLAYLNKPEIPVLFLGTIAAAVNGVIFPIFGSLMGSVIKTFFEPPHELRKESKFWAVMFLVLGMASLLASPSRAYLFAVAGCRLIKTIRAKCFEKVVYMEVSWFDEAEYSSGAIGARLSTDAASLRGLVGDALGLVVQNMATTIAGLIIAFVANWQLALVILVLLPLLALNGFIQVQYMKGFSEDAKVFP